MKRLKQSLLGSTVMLLVAAVMLTSASFAWFTISTNPEISGMSMQVVVNENLEIALDNGYADEAAVDTASGTEAGPGHTGNAYTWGNLIDLGAVPATTATTNYAALDKTLRPATYTDADTFKTASYGPDGRVDAIDITLDKVNRPLVDGKHVGLGNLREGIDSDDLNYGYYVDFWVRTNMDLAAGNKLTLIDPDGADRSSDGAEGAGSTFTTTNADLRANIRFSFVDITGSPIQLATMKPGAAVDNVSPLVYVDHYAGGAGTPPTEVTALVRNEAKKIRMYVYLEGANVTSSSASIIDDLVTGALNLQFTIGDLQSMDVDE